MWSSGFDEWDRANLDKGERAALARYREFRRLEQIALHTSYTPEREREDELIWADVSAYDPRRR